MTTHDVEQLFAGHVLSLARSALPALASRASVRIDGGGLDAAQRVHAATSGPSGPAVRRVGPVAVVPLVGLITSDPFWAWLFGGTTPDGLAKALQDAVADIDVTSVLLVVDSPGGDVSLITETAAEIRRLQAVKRITSLARTEMHSAAFWLAAQATQVFATPSAAIGSVGAYTIHYDESGFNQRVGIVPEYIASSLEKVEGNSAAPLGDDARAFLQARVNEAAGAFVADLARGRGLTPACVRADFGAGRSFGAAEAQRRGMVDGVRTLEALLASATLPRRTGTAALSAQDVADRKRLGLPVPRSADPDDFQADLDWINAH